MRFLQIIAAPLFILLQATEAKITGRPRTSPAVVYSPAEEKWPREAARAAGRISETCSECLMTDGWIPDSRHGSVLQCYCIDDGGWYHTAYIWLDRKIGNNNGQLIWNSSKFFETCDNQEILDNHILQATCARSDGTRPLSKLDLEAYIEVNQVGDFIVIPVVGAPPPA
ncbi:hypothetical protein RB597_007533 [Gaeumannomyces tritici]